MLKSSGKRAVSPRGVLRNYYRRTYESLRLSFSLFYRVLRAHSAHNEDLAKAAGSLTALDNWAEKESPEGEGIARDEPTVDPERSCFLRAADLRFPQRRG